MIKTKPLLNLTAADLMTEALVILPQEMRLCTAAHLLSDNQASGAPVVDDLGRCVGVLSATDFLHWAEKGGFKPDQDAICQPWEIVEPHAARQDLVRNFMTANPVMVAPQATMRDLARKMVDAHIHRVIVVDDEDRPIGIVASTDILAAVAFADLSGSPMF